MVNEESLINYSRECCSTKAELTASGNIDDNNRCEAKAFTETNKATTFAVIRMFPKGHKIFFITSDLIERAAK